MTVSRLWFYLVVFVIGCTVQGALAVDWPPIGADEQSMTSVPEQPGASAVILLRQETDDDNFHVETVYTRIKILTEAGRHYADVELPYNRRGFTIEQISGRTVHADGTVVPFAGAPFDKVVVKSHNLRIQVKTFSLPDVQVGSIVDYRYSLRYGDNSLRSPEWLIQSEIPEKKVVFKFIPFDSRGNRYVLMDHGRTATGVAWTPFLPAGHMPRMETAPNGATSVGLEMENVAPLVEEPFMPPANPLRWRVQFYYQVELKSDEFWKKEGKFWNKDVESFLDHRKAVPETVTQNVAAGDTPEAKVRKIYAFVSQLDNLSYTPQRTEQEVKTLGLKPVEGVDDVLREHGGTHDQLNRLFVAMARAAGIPAQMMWVADRSEDLFEPEFLSTAQLDAEIAVVQLNGKDVFLDPGTKYCPYGILNWHYSGSSGLRQSDKGAGIAESAMPTYPQAIIKRVAKLRLTDEGTMEGQLAVGYAGIEAMIRRREGNRTDAEGRKKLLEEETRSWLPGGTEVTLINSPDWANPEGMLIAEFKISGPLATSAGKRWIIPVHVFEVNEKARFPSAERKNPVFFDYPSREIDEVHISFPSNIELENLPPGDQAKFTYGLCTTTQKVEGVNAILSTRDIAVATMAFRADEYKDLKGFFDKVKADDDESAILKSAPHAQGN